MSRQSLSSLYEDYPAFFGEDGLGVGDEIQNICDEENMSRNRKQIKGQSKTKKSTLPTMITGIDEGEYDVADYSIRTHVADYFSERQQAEQLNMIENTIPNELKEINASRYDNATIEKKYKDQFKEKPVDDFVCPKTWEKSPPPAAPTTSSPVVCKPKKKTKTNALVEGLKKNALLKNENSNICDLTSSIASSDSSVDFYSAQTSPDESYLTSSSGELSKPSKRKHATSKRLSSKFNELSITVQKPRVKKEIPKYEPEYYNNEFKYNAEEFPAI